MQALAGGLFLISTEGDSMQAGRKTLSELEAMVNRKIGRAVGHGRSHDEYLHWTLEHGAINLLGELTPWEAAAIKEIVMHSGTIAFAPDHDDRLPGIPLEWLSKGGRDGTDERLKVPGGRAVKRRISDLMTKLETAEIKSRGVMFRIGTLEKSFYGCVAYETVARTAPLTMKTLKVPANSGPALSLRRAKL